MTPCQCGSKAIFMGLCASCYEKAHAPTPPPPPPSQDHGKTRRPGALSTNLVLRAASMAAESTTPPRVALAGNFFRVPEVSIWLGRPFSGKTWILLHAALEIAQGGLLFDRYPVNLPGPSLYIYGDQDASLIRDRLRVMGNDGEGLYVASKRELQRQASGAWDISSPVNLAQLSEAIGEIGARLVVLDSLFSLTTKSEKKEEEMKPIMDALQGIAQRRQCHIAIAHHLRKPQGYRDPDTLPDTYEGSGSTILPRAAGEVYGCKGEQTETGIQGWCWPMGGWYRRDRPFRFEVVEREDAVILAFDHEADARSGAVYRILEDIKRQEGNFTIGDLGYPREEIRTVQRALSLAVEEGHILRTGHGRSTAYRRKGDQ